MSAASGYAWSRTFFIINESALHSQRVCNGDSSATLLAPSVEVKVLPQGVVSIQQDKHQLHQHVLRASSIWAHYGSLAAS